MLKRVKGGYIGKLRGGKKKFLQTGGGHKTQEKD